MLVPLPERGAEWVLTTDAKPFPARRVGQGHHDSYAPVERLRPESHGADRLSK